MDDTKNAPVRLIKLKRIFIFYDMKSREFHLLDDYKDVQSETNDGIHNLMEAFYQYKLGSQN